MSVKKIDKDMTNEEEVILALKELKNWEGLPYCIEEPMQNEGIAVITKEALDKAIKVLEQTMWIPVTERLPASDEDVFATNGTCRYVGWIDPIDNKWRVDSCSEYFVDDIIAWMPLPEPYRK